MVLIGSAYDNTILGKYRGSIENLDEGAVDHSYVYDKNFESIDNIGSPKNKEEHKNR